MQTGQCPVHHDYISDKLHFVLRYRRGEQRHELKRRELEFFLNLFGKKSDTSRFMRVILAQGPC